MKEIFGKIKSPQSRYSQYTYKVATTTTPTSTRSWADLPQNHIPSVQITEYLDYCVSFLVNNKGDCLAKLWLMPAAGTPATTPVYVLSQRIDGRMMEQSVGDVYAMIHEDMVKTVFEGW